MDPVEKADRVDPTEATDRAEPTEPMLSTEPADPIDRTDPALAIDRNESSEHNERSRIGDIVAPHPDVAPRHLLGRRAGRMVELPPGHPAPAETAGGPPRPGLARG